MCVIFFDFFFSTTQTNIHHHYVVMHFPHSQTKFFRDIPYVTVISVFFSNTTPFFAFLRFLSFERRAWNPSNISGNTSLCWCPKLWITRMIHQTCWSKQDPIPSVATREQRRIFLLRQDGKIFTWNITDYAKQLLRVPLCPREVSLRKDPQTSLARFTIQSKSRVSSTLRYRNKTLTMSLVSVSFHFFDFFMCDGVGTLFIKRLIMTENSSNSIVLFANSDNTLFLCNIWRLNQANSEALMELNGFYVAAAQSTPQFRSSFSLLLGWVFPQSFTSRILFELLYTMRSSGWQLFCW